MFDVPILRAGRPYHSRETVDLTDYATGQTVARVSQANAGLISRDLGGEPWPDLLELSCATIIERFREAADHFMTSDLPVGQTTLSPEEFVAAQSATTGLPHSLCRENMKKIEAAMTNVAGILAGLTGGLDLAVLDAGFGRRDGHVVSYSAKARRFGAVLPANSPGVHALWVPAIALKASVALRPGLREPWTPLRILEAFRKVGLPESALGFYPSGHDGAGVILRKCGASMIFGAGPTVQPWLGDPRVEIHGPGYSKVLLGPDMSDSFAQFLDLLFTSVASNGGRSCINASCIRTVSHGRELALALAERLAQVVPRERRDPQALLAAFPDPAVAKAIDASIERELAQGGAEDVTARFRSGQRLVEYEGGTYLLPTVIHCDDARHPLANQEFLFPFVSVAEVPVDDLADVGPSLVVTAVAQQASLERSLMDRSDVGRLNLGPVPTSVVQWDQPHEGNIFEHLYRQRAFQRATFDPIPAGAS